SVSRRRALSRRSVVQGTVAVSEVVLHEDWIGHRVTDLEQATGARVAFLIRFGAGVLPEPKSVIQAGDQVYV
ncbi:TrkA C-terminal domain-containing protein, partial [Mycobacterium intracellulare]|uniref:TrkA C-terminal domain-containing protein n=1 Tax=Mycobacterium intracellulare TaxID=1767 RepID=UPI001916AF26